jgi:hypothetical protein
MDKQKHVETYPRTETPAFVDASTTGRITASDSAMVMLMFFLLNVSEAAVKTAIRPIPAFSARSRPFMFGTSAEYRTPGNCGSRGTSSSASAS